jgi:hypothetical protein
MYEYFKILYALFLVSSPSIAFDGGTNNCGLTINIVQCSDNGKHVYDDLKFKSSQ